VQELNSTYIVEIQIGNGLAAITRKSNSSIFDNVFIVGIVECKSAREWTHVKKN